MFKYEKPKKGYKKGYKKTIKFFLKYPDKWHSYAKDYETVNLICCLVNLSILHHKETPLNEHNQVKINPFNANLYLDQG
jgi:hypothetical protein